MAAKGESLFYRVEKTEELPAFDIKRNQVTVQKLYAECTLLSVHSMDGVMILLNRDGL